MAMVASCASSNAQSRGGSVTEATTRHTSFIVTSTNTCSDIVTPPDNETGLSLLIAPLVSFAADSVFGAINAYVDQRKKDLNGAFLASGAIMQNPGNVNCIGIVRGTIGEANFNDRRKGKIPQPSLQALGLSDYPDFMLLLNLNSSGDSLEITAEHLRYASTSARRNGSSQKNVAVVLGFSKTPIESASGITKDSTIARAPINLGKLSIGRYYEADTLTDVSFGLPLGNDDWKAPISITASVVESEEPSLALTVLSKAWEDNKGDFQTAFEELLKSALGSDDDDSN